MKILMATITLVVQISTRLSFEPYIREVSKSYNLSPYLVEAVIEKESGWDEQAESTGGAMGLMQIVPKWHMERMDKLGCKQLKKGEDNILVGCDYISELCDRFGNVEEALMFYNQGWLGIEYYEAGIISQYAADILDRAYELEQERNKTLEVFLGVERTEK